MQHAHCTAPYHAASVIESCLSCVQPAVCSKLNVPTARNDVQMNSRSRVVNVLPCSNLKATRHFARLSIRCQQHIHAVGEGGRG